jgi:small subunit ribosomal protein S1
MSQNTSVNQPTMDDLLKRVGGEKELEAGDRIAGTIIYITKSEVILDIDNIGLGLVRGKELYNDEYISLLKEGEKVEAVVLDLDNERGMLELSFRAVGRDKIWSELTKIYEEKNTVEAKIRDVNRGGFLVKVQGVYGFLPASLLSPTHAIKQATGIESNNLLNQMKRYVGQTFNVKLLSMNEESDTVVVSEKAVSDEINAVKLSKYAIGDVIHGTVVGVVDFGIFIRFDTDLEGLVHISEIAWRKIDKTHNEYKIGDSVSAKIIEIDADHRINLSIKQTLENPWVKFAKKTKVGDVFTGIVQKITSFGVLASNEDEIQGLCHISQLQLEAIDNPAKLHDIVKIGEKMDFQVLALDSNEKLYLTKLPLDIAETRHAENKQKEEEAAKAKTANPENN